MCQILAAWLGRVDGILAEFGCYFKNRMNNKELYSFLWRSFLHLAR